MEKAELFWTLRDQYEGELLSDPRGTRDKLVLAFKHCLHRGQQEEALLLWPILIKAIILSWENFYQLDEYLRWYKSVQVPDIFLLIPEVRASMLGAYFVALVFRKPEADELPLLEGELFNTLRECQRENIRAEGLFSLALRAFWQGRFTYLDQLIETFGQKTQRNFPYGSLINSLIQAAKHIWVYFDLKKAQKDLNRALELAEKERFLLANHIVWAMKTVCALVEEDYWEASRCLAKMESSLGQTGRYARSRFFHLAAWMAFMRKDFNKAELAMRKALQLARETGYQYPCYLLYFALAQILFKKGALPEALRALKKCEAFAQKTRSQMLLFLCLLFRAYLAYLCGERLFGRHFLRRALRLGNRENYFLFAWWWNREMVAYLCARALEEGFCENYVRQLILKHHLAPPSHFRPTQKWSYPIRIHTLGELQIAVDEIPVSLPQKRATRPISLLMALVVAGGELSKGRILDLFWAEQEADTAYHALESTLYRLRKILKKDVFFSKGRKVSLKKEMLYVDLWDLKNKLNRLDAALASRKTSQSFFLAEDILLLYKDLLPGFDHPFVLFEQKWLKTRTVSLLQKTALLLEKELPEKSLFLYEKAWMLDPGDEKACQLLIKALVRKDRLEEASKAYHHLAFYLKSHYQTEPSPELKSLMSKIEARQRERLSQ